MFSWRRKKNPRTAPAADENSTTTMVSLMGTRNKIRIEPGQTIYLLPLWPHRWLPTTGRRRPKGAVVVNPAHCRISERVEESDRRFGRVRAARGSTRTHTHAQSYTHIRARAARRALARYTVLANPHTHTRAHATTMQSAVKRTRTHAHPPDRRCRVLRIRSLVHARTHIRAAARFSLPRSRAHSRARCGAAHSSSTGRKTDVYHYYYYIYGRFRTRR